MLFNIITCHFHIPDVYFSLFMIISVEKHAQGFLWKCAKKTFIYRQNLKVADSERYWTLLTQGKIRRCI